MRPSLIILSLTVAVLVAATGFVSGSRPAETAFPGFNGMIAFQTDRDGNAEIYTMSADGSAQTNLTNDPAEDQDPAWSPNGLKIAFHSNRDGDNEIFVMNADGSGVTQVTTNTGDDFAPV